MASDYAKYLAGAILTENQIVTYRLLSRVLKVHHSEAKRMLYEFHRQQNTRKPGSVHATYLVTGIQVVERAIEPSQTGLGDSFAPSSPYMSSFAVTEAADEVVSVRQRVLTLVKEESLEAAKGRYESVSSVHVYSLEPNTLKNLEMLSSVTQKIMTEYISEDPLIHNKTYGVIQNASVKRRSGVRPLPKPLPIKEETKTAFAKSKDPKSSQETKTLSKPKEAPPGSGEQATKVGAPAVMKRESSDLFKSFAKTKPKAKATASTSARANEDTTMKDASDASDEDMDLSTEDAAFAARRARRLEQKEKLRRLQEDDDDDEDEPMPDSNASKAAKASTPASDGEPSPKAASSRSASPENDSADDTPSAPIDAPPKQDDPEPEQPAVTVAGGRRRGRRKVTKKKVTRDAEGNIETQEVVDWESFSEDEVPPPTLIKAKFSSGAGAKTKKAVGKPGQGNIMSFFGKK